MSDFNHIDKELLSRRQAAEHLVDIAYSLTAGGPLEVSMAGRRIKIPMANELHMERELKSDGERVALELELKWSSPEG